MKAHLLFLTNSLIACFVFWDNINVVVIYFSRLKLAIVCPKIRQRTYIKVGFELKLFLFSYSTGGQNVRIRGSGITTKKAIRLGYQHSVAPLFCGRRHCGAYSVEGAKLAIATN